MAAFNLLVIIIAFVVVMGMYAATYDAVKIMMEYSHDEVPVDPIRDGFEFLYDIFPVLFLFGMTIYGYMSAQKPTVY